MTTMSTGYRNAIATHGASLITHIGLVNDAGVELTEGDPAYSRLAVAWGAPDNGYVRLANDYTFNIPAGTTVGGWRGYSGVTGGTNFGGGDLPHELFPFQGTYTLRADLTGVQHANG